ncbi:hypothetical protein LCGC14_0930820 [marine sediment metagenome]|uniref:Uncharacterized protein n=1 Tax=marine sediment metagenome TaxID=412755 RepID=A0A0F9RUK2_9ZZZZ|nr:hypothetical protein [archaeon]
MSTITLKIESVLVEKVVEIAKRRKPYKTYKTSAKAIREALEFFIEENQNNTPNKKLKATEEV